METEKTILATDFRKRLIQAIDKIRQEYLRSYVEDRVDGTIIDEAFIKAFNNVEIKAMEEFEMLEKIMLAAA